MLNFPVYLINVQIIFHLNGNFKKIWEPILMSAIFTEYNN